MFSDYQGIAGFDAFAAVVILALKLNIGGYCDYRSTALEIHIKEYAGLSADGHF
jgi:hypothetical protein